MADITSTLNSWSSTSSSNLPANSASVGPNTLADNQRTIQAVVRAALAGDGTIASAATTDLSTVNDGDITVTGTTTITGFGTLTAGIKKVLTFSGALTLTHNATSLILPGAANITTAAGDVAIMRSLGSGNWKCISFTRSASLPATAGANTDITSMTALTAPTVAANPIRATDLQVQLATAFTTGGTSTAFTLTPTPAITANTANQRFRINFNAAAGSTPTLAVSGQTAKSLKYKDSTGTKQAITATQVPSGWVSDVEYDGTDWVVLDVLSFGKSIGTNGYSKIGDGLTLQWGVVLVTTGTPFSLTFPIAFSTAIYSLTLGLNSPSGAGNTVYSNAVTTSGASISVAGTAGSSNVYWMAIGI